MKTTSKRIRKDPATRNRYLPAGGLWVRNFTQHGVTATSANNLISVTEHTHMLHNEMTNRTLNLGNIADEKFHFPNVVIVSDGYDFDNRHLLLGKLRKDVCIIGVNGALASWKLWNIDGDRRAMNMYVVNNPYQECMSYLPKHKYFPSCVASIRTYPDFVRKFMGQRYVYEPSPERFFSTSRPQTFYVDDYRNPICAAIVLAFRFHVQRLLLLCCDDSFTKERPAAVRLDNGLWSYPQQLLAHDVIDANLYWLSHQENLTVSIANYSSGPECVNANPVSDVEGAIKFFEQPNV